VSDEEGRIDPWGIPGIGPRDRTAAVGGRLLVRESNGRLRPLVEPPVLFDVADPCVSWDGEQVVFAGLAHADSAWRIYSIRADGTGLRAITRSDRRISLKQFGPMAARFVRYDDIDPCWLPDGRLCFASTRYPTIAEAGGYPATNLFVVEAEGTRMHRITSDRNGAEEPAIDPLTGRVVYCRWLLNVDRPSHTTATGLTVLDDEALTQDVGNIWETLSITPDGREAQLHAGDPRTRAGLVAYKPSPLRDGRTLVLAAPNGSFSPSPGGAGIRVHARGASPGRTLLGWRAAPVAATGPPTPPFAADPVELPDGRLLVAYVSNARGDWGLYVTNAAGEHPKSLIDLPGTLELDPAVLAPTRVPPALADQIDAETAELPPTADPATWVARGTFRLDCLNVFANAPVDAPIPDAPPAVAGARGRLYLSFQRQSTAGRDTPILFRDGPLTAHGAIAEQGIPADVSLFDQIVDANGRVLVGHGGTPAHLAGMNFGRHGGWAQCVGCHAGHSVIEIPSSFSAAEWFNVSTSARVTASSTWQDHSLPLLPATPRSIIDRRARCDSLQVAWVAAGRDGEHVSLEWDVAIEVSRLVLYGVFPSRRTRTDLRVQDCRVALLRRQQTVYTVSHTGPVLPDGTPVDVPPTVIDGLRIEILDAQGVVAGQPRVGLAEVETIARLAIDRPTADEEMKP
jgi:hypothetical protein